MWNIAWMGRPPVLILHRLSYCSNRAWKSNLSKGDLNAECLTLVRCHHPPTATAGEKNAISCLTEPHRTHTIAYYVWFIPFQIPRDYFHVRQNEEKTGKPVFFSSFRIVNCLFSFTQYTHSQRLWQRQVQIIRMRNFKRGWNNFNHQAKLDLRIDNNNNNGDDDDKQRHS